MQWATFNRLCQLLNALGWRVISLSEKMNQFARNIRFKLMETHIQHIIWLTLLVSGTLLKNLLHLSRFASWDSCATYVCNVDGIKSKFIRRIDVCVAVWRNTLYNDWNEVENKFTIFYPLCSLRGRVCFDHIADITNRQTPPCNCPEPCYSGTMRPEPEWHLSCKKSP